MKAKSDERTGMMSLSALDLSRMIKNKELSVVDVVLSSLEEIEKKDKDINAFITVCEREDLIKRAEQVQKQIDNGELKNSPLAGVPIAIKDNICTRGIRTTCGSAILKNFVPPYSATAVGCLEKAGLIIMGKTNMDEFGMGNTTSNSCFGATLNPVSFAKLDPSTGVERSFFRDNPNSNEHMINGYTAGGSSGGSAAAVAAGMVPIALGTDTGGSIRQPSSHCGVYGIKPTYGTVSRYGLIAYASSMDQIGPIASHPEDLAAVLKIISGSDIRDETCTDSLDLIKASISNKDRIKIAVISAGQSPKLSLHPAVVNALKEAESKLESKGASLSDISIPELEFALYAYYIITCAEASSNLSRYDGVKYGYRTPEYEDLDEMVKKTRSEGFGEEVKRRILLGTFALSEGFYDKYYQKACDVRTMIKRRFDELLTEYDAIMSPVYPTPAETFDELKAVKTKIASDGTDMSMSSYFNDIFTVPANLAGLPAISIPAGGAVYSLSVEQLKSSGSSGKVSIQLPVGVQLITKKHDEELLLFLAGALGDYEE